MPEGDASSPSAAPEVRKGQGNVTLSREEFRRRIGERFYDPMFDTVRGELERVVDVAWDAYHDYRKSPRSVVSAVRLLRDGRFERPDRGLPDPRPK